jgi:DNA-binding LacI/PurR family transcriptional regulator
VPYVTLRSTATGSAPDALVVDEIAGSRLATAHLLDLGHRGVRHLAGPRDWTEADARMQGFLLELSDRDMSVLPPVLGDWTAEFGYRAGLELLRRRDATAYFCANDQMALGLMHAARDLGLDVPRDVSIVGYDDVPEAAHLWPPLTTVRTDFADLGRRCVLALIGEDPGRPSRAPAPLLIVRGTTAPPVR